MGGHATSTGRSLPDNFRLDHAFVVKATLAIRIQKSISET